jgi:hypothetical protein
VLGNEFYNGKEVEFVSPRDYVLIPEISKKLSCENGKWKGIIPSCKGIKLRLLFRVRFVFWRVEFTADATIPLH